MGDTVRQEAIRVSEQIGGYERKFLWARFVGKTLLSYPPSTSFLFPTLNTIISGALCRLAYFSGNFN